MLEQVLRDIRYGLRQLARHPVFTLVAAVALGLGIGSVTTQISVINGAFLKGLPFPDPDRIAYLERVPPPDRNLGEAVPVLEFLEWRQRQEGFEALSGYYSGTVNLTQGSLVQRYSGAFVSGNLFKLLGVKARLGRALEPADERPDAPDVVVLSHNVWTRDFGSDPDVIGRPAVVNGRSATIIGVMPEEFDFPVHQEAWLPLFKYQDPATLSWGEPGMVISVVGRLKPGVTYAAANDFMNRVARQIQETYGESADEGFHTVRVKPFLDEFLGEQTLVMTSVMLLITVLILVIACANVANLLLARSVRRQKEVAIRSALGATRQRIISQFLTESVLLSIIGGTLGLVIAVRNLRGINEASRITNTPLWMEFTIDARIFAGVAVITFATGIVSGLVPALRASRLRENEILKDDTRTGSSLQIGSLIRFLVILQISVAAVILTLVILFVQSTRNAMSLDYAYNPDRVMSARIALFEQVYPDEASREAFISTLLDRLRARPEIDLAATTDRYQFIGGISIPYEMPDRIYRDDSERDIVVAQRVSPEFMEALGLPVLRGRGFETADFASEWPRHVIVNEAFALREWNRLDVVGERFRPELVGLGPGQSERPWVEIIGVTRGMQEAGPFPSAEEDGAAVFLPQTTNPYPRFITILARGPGPADELLPVMREEISALDANLPLYEAGTPREVNNRILAQFGFFAEIFTVFGVLATFLAAIGIYGVITFSVDQRLVEFGIRQALGSTRGAVFRLVYRHAFRQLGIGFLIALFVLSPLILFPGVKEHMSLFFHEIDPDSVVPYLVAFGFVAVIALLSATPPAIRAARTEPAKALRHE